MNKHSLRRVADYHPKTALEEYASFEKTIKSSERCSPCAVEQMTILMRRLKNWVDYSNGRFATEEFNGLIVTCSYIRQRYTHDYRRWIHDATFGNDDAVIYFLYDDNFDNAGRVFYGGQDDDFETLLSHLMIIT